MIDDAELNKASAFLEKSELGAYLLRHPEGDVYLRHHESGALATKPVTGIEWQRNGEWLIVRISEYDSMTVGSDVIRAGGYWIVRWLSDIGAIDIDHQDSVK